MPRVSIAFVLVMGCGVSQSEFIPGYAERYCELVLDCGNAADLVFDGLDTQKECLAVEGPRVESWGKGCKYKGGKARKCLAELDEMTCPSPGASIDEALPAVCNDIYLDCDDDIDSAR